HCHQKALVGTAPTVAALTWAGFQVTEVDSGCCGMAGSFGFEAEHYDISVAIGNRRLAPAVKALSSDTEVIAPGISCRQQSGHLGHAPGAASPGTAAQAPGCGALRAPRPTDRLTLFFLD